MKLFPIPCLLISCLFTGCMYLTKKMPSHPLQQEFLSDVRDSMILDDFHSVHYGAIEVSNGFLISSNYDKRTRQNGRFHLHDLNSKKDYGYFPWPNEDGTFYFGIDHCNDYLLYFENNYFKRVNIFTKKLDTVYNERFINGGDWTSMVVINDIAYSTYSNSGLAVLSMKDRSKLLDRQHETGNSLYIQNNISLPVFYSSNLVASVKVTPDSSELYCIDTAMNVLWKKRIAAEGTMDYQIASLNFKDRFLVKHDTVFEVISKTDGRRLFYHTFNTSVYDICKLDDANVLVILSAKPTISRLAMSMSTDYKTVLCYNPQNDSVKYRIDGLKTASERYFRLNNRFYFFAGNARAISINVKDGAVDTFRLQHDFQSEVRVLQDKKTGKWYLLNGGVVYW
ncbi:hypothetical protein [Chitinophaga sp. GbtcB8]|uniref:hypothetical protein n=1 Tax=Chitinophaga sp. GbtcB8 TaxID=2824753 RepID=UPI001C30980C|nr:hypothetical protein [Chitinophaga sp. GbtcB8]